MSMETQDISASIINDVMHKFQDKFDNTSASGSTISSGISHIPQHRPHAYTGIIFMSSLSRRVQ